MRSEELPAIRQLPLFADMSEDSFTSLLQAAYLQTFPPQVQLITEGDAADFLHVVVEGTIEIPTILFRRRISDSTRCT